eukprot:TRINITY_DN15396_c0_g1_i1.p1 TRINITY_DN15396_c0_g1~~TRINITY_DN15396_c0_g1_i1.p1  ORF type:complete len:269 (-),score=56.87 TRINITY_DN15396_c0_g1_i1:128-934(-)
MARGPKKHLKRIAAPKAWMLSKLGGSFAQRPSQGPHKLRESIPIGVILRHRLKLALTRREIINICNAKEGNVRIDNRLRRDAKFPVGLMDVFSLDKANESYRVLYDVRGRFTLKLLKKDEANFKLCKVKRKEIGPNKIPYIVTNDARTIRFPHPDIDVNDTVKINLVDNKIVDYCKFEAGNVALITGGNNIGRVGIITHRERHLGGFDIVHLKDANGKSIATRISNIFVVGKGKKPWISLPADNGLYLSALEAKEARENARRKEKAGK